MAEAALVERDVEAGQELLSALDAAGFPVFAALWLMRSEETGWSFCVGSPEVEAKGRHAAYAEIQSILTKAGTPLPLRDVTLLGAEDPLLQLLGTAINVATGQVRFTNNVINGVLIPDALIFRMQRPTQPGSPTTTDAMPPPEKRSKPKATKRTNAPKK